MLRKAIYIFLFITLNSINIYGQNISYIPIIEAQRLELEQHFFNGIKNKYLYNNDIAEKEFLKCVEIYPRHSASLYELGIIYLEKKEVSRSIEYLKGAALLDEYNTWYWEKLIDAYKIMNKFEDIAKTYQKLITLYPDNKLYYKNAATFWFSVGQSSKSISVYKKYEKKMGVTEDVSLELERLYLFKKQPQKALNQLRKLRDSDTSNLRYMGLLADLYTDLGFEKDAFVLYSKIISKDPSNGLACFALADYYAQQKDYQKMNEYLKSGLSDERISASQKIPILQEKLQGLSNKKTSKGELLDFFEIVEKVHPEEQEFYWLHGAFLTRLGKPAEAATYYEKCLEL
ncbi:MAG: hypothetical protein HYZ42_12555, partial [Bacteroidetes bacterium]|nr:hypothetical protein [Bacteroidota bacterium]